MRAAAAVLSMVSLLFLSGSLAAQGQIDYSQINFDDQDF